jgi:hypothetical protein
MASGARSANGAHPSTANVSRMAVKEVGEGCIVIKVGPHHSEHHGKHDRIREAAESAHEEWSTRKRRPSSIN